MEMAAYAVAAIYGLAAIGLAVACGGVIWRELRAGALDRCEVLGCRREGERGAEILINGRWCCESCFTRKIYGLAYRGRK